MPKSSQGDSSATPKYPGLFLRIARSLGTEKTGEIARKIGVKDSSVSEWKQGERPSLENLILIAELGNTSLEWLLKGETGEKGKYGDSFYVYLGEAERDIVSRLADEAEREIEDQIRELVIEGLIRRGLVDDKVEGANLVFFSDHVPKLVPMKLLGTIAAGSPINVFEENETVMVAEDFVVRGRKGFVLRVAGESMIDDGIHDGDLVICYESNTANNGQMVVALIEGDQATVKRFYKERGRIRLQPANPRFNPLILPPDQVRIQGIVVGIQRRP